MKKKEILSTIKEFYLLCRYVYLRIYKKIFNLGFLSILLFSITFIILLYILIPTFQHSVPIADNWFTKFELTGMILFTQENNSRSYGIPGAKVEIGGFDSTTDYNGNYKIKFLSKSRSEIPMVITYANRTLIKHISYADGEYDKTEIFVLK